MKWAREWEGVKQRKMAKEDVRERKQFSLNPVSRSKKLCNLGKPTVNGGNLN
jgi:hypothetical protein